MHSLKLVITCICISGFVLVVAPTKALSGTITCMGIGPNMMSCDTPLTAAELKAQSEAAEQFGRSIGEAIIRAREGAFRKRVGKLLANGDCQGATRLAFESGRLELGQSISENCHLNSQLPTKSFSNDKYSDIIQ